MTDGGYTTRSAHKLVDGISGLVKQSVPARLISLLLTAYGRLSALLYRGNALTCPCCGRRFRRFEAYGAVKRHNSMCPRCRSFETTCEVETSPGAGRLKAYDENDQLRIYGRDFQERLESAGFIVTREDYAAGLGPDALRKYALNPSSSIYLCTKPVFF